MKDLPILFNTPMVLAILDGRKTMTRRILKTPLPIGVKWWEVFDGELIYRMVDSKTVLTHCKCRYGKIGDFLWVRETFAKTGDNFHDNWPGHGDFYYRADDPYSEMEENSPVKGIPKWRSSIYMPKVAHRICLEITKIRVERLNDITEEDAIREGIEIIDKNPDGFTYKSYIPKLMANYACPIGSFESLWNSINLKKCPSWNNPWVWVIEFKIIA
jgi:hypothetical protein